MHRNRGFQAAFLLLLGLYVGGYFAVSRSYPGYIGHPSSVVHFRAFPNRFIKSVYAPMGWIEAGFRRHPVQMHDNFNEGGIPDGKTPSDYGKQ